MAATKKTAPTKAAPAKAAPKPKVDKTICRWGAGRYFSPATAKACTAPKAPKRELCAAHEVSMRAAKKALNPTTPKAKAPRSAGSSPKTAGGGTTMERELAAVKATRKPARNSGGAKRTTTPPVPEMGTGIPVARVNAPEQAPHLVQLIAE